MCYYLLRTNLPALIPTTTTRMTNMMIPKKPVSAAMMLFIEIATNIIKAAKTNNTAIPLP